MAIGKNKRLTKSKKGGKKKAVDPFLKKEWYEIKAPSMFSVRNCGKTLVTRTQGTKIASDALKGRVFEISLGDLNNDEDQTYRKIKLICEDVQGYNCLTNFHGMGMTRDKLASLIKKWQTLVEGNVDVKTTDGYTLRMFCIAFTTKMPNQIAKACYANSGPTENCVALLAKAIVGHAKKCYDKHPAREDYMGCTSNFCFNECGEAEGCSEMCDEKTEQAYAFFNKAANKERKGKAFLQLSDESHLYKVSKSFNLHQRREVPKDMDAHKCRVLCQRFMFKSLGKAFEDINHPNDCMPKCDEVFPKAKETNDA